MDSDEDSKNNKIKRILQLSVFPIIQYLILFISAGNLNFPRLWVYFGVSSSYHLVSTIILFRYFPKFIELIDQRGKKREGTKSWDKVFAALYAPAVFAIPLIVGLDVGRYHWSNISLYISLLCIILYILGSILGHWAMVENKYFESTVRIQKERGHKIISSGPYKIVRHPGYVSIIIIHLTFPLIAGSFYGLIPAGIATTLMIVRTSLEDKTLQKELDGYSKYAKKVKYRLFPLVW